MRLKKIYYVLAVICLAYGTARAQQKSTTLNAENDSDNLPSKFGIGFYAGTNMPYTQSKVAMSPGGSFMLYGYYNINRKWQVEVGFGGVFYNGKTLGYMGTQNVYDTVYEKNYSVTGLGYTTVPIIFKYGISNKLRLLLGIRWMAVSAVHGNGTYGIVSHDSLAFKSNLSPSLPGKANFMDVQGVAGIEFAFSKHFLATLTINAGAVPIFPSRLNNESEPKIGNYNDALEIGLNYIIPSKRPI